MKKVYIVFENRFGSVLAVFDSKEKADSCTKKQNSLGHPSHWWVVKEYDLE